MYFQLTLKFSVFWEWFNFQFQETSDEDDMETEKKRERTDDCDGFVSKEKYERMIKVSEVTNYTLLYTNSYLKTQHFTFF